MGAHFLKVKFISVRKEFGSHFVSLHMVFNSEKKDNWKSVEFKTYCVVMEISIFMHGTSRS